MTERGLLYLDASALVKLVIPEEESTALIAFLRHWPRRVASALVRAEVPRAVVRASAEISVHNRAEQVVAGVGLIPVDLETLSSAAALSPVGLRTLDAIHLATALSLGSDLRALVAYDERLVDAAHDHGIAVSAPRS